MSAQISNKELAASIKNIHLEINAIVKNSLVDGTILTYVFYNQLDDFITSLKRKWANLDLDSKIIYGANIKPRLTISIFVNNQNYYSYDYFIKGVR